MLDNLTLEIFAPEYLEHAKGKQQPFKYRELEFNPNYFKGRINYWYAMLENLRIQIFSDTLKISNSIHKYYKGNNYSDFHLSELHEAFELLSKCLGIDIFKAQIKSFEIGCNILFKTQKPFLNGLNSYNGNYFDPMKDKKTEYGKKLFATDYNIKFYDKTTQVKIKDKITIPDHLLRFEFEVKYLRYLQKKGIPIYSVEDLFKPKIIGKIIHEIFKVYKGLNKIIIPDLTSLDIGELKCYAILKDKELTNVVKSKSMRNYCSYKKKILNKIDNSIFDKVEQLIAEKFTQLSEGYFQTCNIVEKA